MQPSIKRLAVCEAQWLYSKPWYDAGDVDNAANRVISMSGQYTPLHDSVVNMITDIIDGYAKQESDESKERLMLENRLDQLLQSYPD